MSAARRALVVWGGWPGHEPQQAVDTVIPSLREADFDVTVSESLDSYLDTGVLAATDLIVQCWTMGEASDEQVRGVTTAVAKGTGFAGWHGGILDAFRTQTDYQFMTGGQWVAHPDDILTYRVDPVGEHTIMAGIDPFEITSEQYYVHVDPSNDVHATTVIAAPTQYPWSRGTTMPVVWTRQWGAGRVFVSTLGHSAADLQLPPVRALTCAGLLWAARGNSR